MQLSKKGYQVGQGDSEALIPPLDENSIHSIITDPPYGLNLMNLSWDKILPSRKIWEECFRVLRPGGFLLAFAHVKLYHRLAVDLEDCGFEIKDCLCWAYASGFPKGLNISKAIDKKKGAEREVVAKRIHPTLKNNPKVKSNAYHVETLDSDADMESWDITAPASDEAKIWNGWGTQLKPAWEAIIMCQKPLEGTYVENVLKYNVGGLNIDECRIPYKNEEDKKLLASFEHFAGKDYGDDRYFSGNSGGKKQCNVNEIGRWPANLIWLDPLFIQYDHIFMVPKPSTRQKGKGNDHDTVKPIDLMERLIKLVTPRPSVVGGDVIVLDPFMGSGTTGIAARNLDRYFIGFEKDQDSFDTAKYRISKQVKDKINIFDT
jgi:DNA modification methylase